MKRIITIVALLFPLVAAFAQGTDDACLFSQTYYQGTAKALGMGNALGAVGGDMTALCVNPAGMGLYRGQELAASLGLFDNLSHSTYYGTTANANTLRLTLPNIGYVNAKQRSNYRNLRFTQFGIALTRTNDFNEHTLARGINPSSSKIDSYLAQIDGYSPQDIKNDFPYDIFPAWSTYLIDIYEDDEGEYYGSPVPQGGIWQGRENTFKGRSEEWTFAGSANYNEDLFLGVSIGLNHVKRTGTRVFEEWMPEDANEGTGFSQWSFTESIASTGWGGNIKTGFIYHANNWLRIGAAFHSPTIFNFNETWQTETEAEINQFLNKHISPESHYEYTFIKPLKWVGSMAFVVGQEAIVCFDAEYQNYGSARFRADDWDYDATNESIKSAFGPSFNFRIGSEWRTGNTYLRVGAGYYGSPFGFGKPNGSVKKASIGISLPAGEVILDFAYELSIGKQLARLYEYDPIQPVEQSQSKSLLIVSLRYR